MSETSETTSPPRPPDLTRRTLTPFGYAICFVVPLVIAALGFTYLHFHYDKEQLVNGTRLHILTSGSMAGDELVKADVAGQLVLDNGCMRLSAPDGSFVDLVWPADYEATVLRNGSTDQLKVYDPARDIVARSAQTIQLHGGFIGVGGFAGVACAPPAGGQVFLVQSEPQVVDAS